MGYIEICGHKLHLFRTGNKNKPKLVFISGSGTVSLVYDFRIIVIEKFGYGCSGYLSCPVISFLFSYLGKIPH